MRVLYIRVGRRLYYLAATYKLDDEIYNHYKICCINRYIVYIYIYIIDAKTKGTTQFRNPRARGCSVLSVAKALLWARGFYTSRIVPIGRGIQLFLK